MNRRSWFKSVLATITIAISDGLPKALVSDPIRVPPRKMKAVWSLETADDLNRKFRFNESEELLLGMINEASKEIWEIQRKATHWIIREPNES